MKMLDKMTDEAIRTVINNAPEGAEYWTSGYDVGYRKLVLDCAFGWFPDDKKWVRAIDNDVAMERIDKGFWIPNLVKELVNRQPQPIPQVKEVEWENGETCIYKGDEWLFVGKMPVKGSKFNAECIIQHKDGAPLPVDFNDISKPETPEAKKEREELEAAYDLYCYAIDLDTPFDKFCNFGPLKDVYVRIVRKTGYRV